MKSIQRVIVSGGAGFTGSILIECLLSEGIEVYAIVRPNSEHNKRLISDTPLLHLIELNPEQYSEIPQKIKTSCDIFYHLMWSPESGTDAQFKNINYSLDALKASAGCGCTRFICTGSQAEYGIVPPDELTTEDHILSPITPYGKAKTKACRITREYAKELHIEWIWGRIFSLIGKYESTGRMLPGLFLNLYSNKESHLTSCRQNWDYLDVYDAANALIYLGKMGQAGEIYNIANGNYRPLKEYTESLRRFVSPETNIIYGEDPNPFISLQPSVTKLKEDTGWQPNRTFFDSINDYRRYLI